MVLQPLVEVFRIHFIAEQPQIVLFGDGGNPVRLFAGHDSTRGVLRRVDDNQFCLVGDFCLKVIGIQAEAVRFIYRHPHILQAEIVGNRKVGRKTGIGKNDFLAGIDQTADGKIDNTVGRHGDDLIQVRPESPSPFDIAANGLPERFDAHGADIPGMPLIQGGFGGFNNVRVGIEIRVANFKSVNFSAGGFHSRYCRQYFQHGLADQTLGEF